MKNAKTPKTRKCKNLCNPLYNWAKRAFFKKIYSCTMSIKKKVFMNLQF